MDITGISDLWWKSAVIYCLDVETFQDGNGDGCGDFIGLNQRVDYLAQLGVTCIWLMPFYPSPNRDDGYDISDYYAVDPRLGTLGDFVEFMRTARNRGIRVIADLVVNHTSDQHAWFQQSRSDPNSRYRDWYVWSDEIPKDGPTEEVFPGKQNGVWGYDEMAKKYFMHRFYGHQPDLNIANREVRDEICRIVGFWLELGLSGFRVDAVPFLLETDGNPDKMDMAPHDFLREMRSFISRRNGEAMLLGEVNLSYEDVRRFFGDESGDELHMCLNFNLNQALALSLVRADSGPLVHSLKSLPSLPGQSGWANFVRNHDEWSLDKLTVAERQDVFDAFGPKPEMQLFDRGLRRRMPTMIDGDPDRLRLVYALNLGLPGASVLFYGEEIGMAENLDIPGRMSVRAPMQWTDGHNGGFSPVPEEDLWRPMVSGRKWGPKAINVEDQKRDPDSLLKWTEAAIWHRRALPEIAFGTLSVLPAEQAEVLSLRYDWENTTLVALFNLGEDPASLAFDLKIDNGAATQLLGKAAWSLKPSGKLTAELSRYGVSWIRIVAPD